MALFGRSPRLLPSGALPDGFAYPSQLVEEIRADRLPAWEWLSGSRLDQAAERLWRVHPRELVPLAVRRGTTFVMCLDAATPSPDGTGFEVVTVDATDASAGTVQHLPDLADWLRAARAEAQGGPDRPAGDPPVRPAATETGTAPSPSADDPAPVDPSDPSQWRTGLDPDVAGSRSADPRSEVPRWQDAGADAADPAVRPVEQPGGTGEGIEGIEGIEGVGWVPRQRGRCGCVHHLDSIATEVVPYAMNAPSGLPPRTVADLVMAGELLAAPDFPGPQIVVGRRRIGPFHWRAGLGQGARLHQDDDGRVALDSWLMWNPGVGFVAWPDRGDLLLHAPDLCHDGVLTLLGRALLDDRVRRRRPRRR